ncbi:MAG: energy transducer TonB [Sphingobium sp.]|uniref:energy transducer TonB n=1 Tax=Sphingobium sp. CECT 9361 TaxID=2845384 RepID=UPI001E55D41F|nr:energy transducer TonB [Sphingobium sp. CECT 9361]CAH0348997.1 hypothetical protein SPH9361_00383 [Sphingobium sp. CECT 9361]
MILVFTIASGIALATPATRSADWIKDSDYPVTEVIRDVQGSTRTMLTVGLDGTIKNCSIAITSGSKILDDKACLILKKRGHFVPAKDEEGKPIFGSFNSSVNWFMAKGRSAYRSNDTDLILVVKKLPKDVKMPSRVIVMALVDADGRLERCEPMAEHPNAKVLGPTACSQVHERIKFLPLLDNAKPVKSVQAVTVGINEELSSRSDK